MDRGYEVVLAMGYVRMVWYGRVTSGLGGNCVTGLFETVFFLRMAEGSGRTPYVRTVG